MSNVVDLARARAALGRLRAATAALDDDQRHRIALWFGGLDESEDTVADDPAKPAPPTATLTVRLTAADLAELEAVTAGIVPRATGRMVRVNRSTVAAEALRAGLDVLRREYDLPPRKATGEDPRQVRIPGA
jgi:hypothetical protein